MKLPLRLTTDLHADMSETINHERILRRCGCDLEHAIRSRCIENYSTENYINYMEEITTRTKIGRNLCKPPMENKTSGKPIPKPNEPHEKAPLKCKKCGSTSHLENTCPKKTRINEIEIDKVEDTKETNNVSLHESDYEPSEEDILDELIIENINVSFEVTERSQVTLDSGAFCTCVGKDYLYRICSNWKESLIPIEGIKFRSARKDMHPLGIFEAAMISPHPAGRNDYLNIYGIDINAHRDRYFTIGGNERQKFASPPEKREITVIRQLKNVNKEKVVSDQSIEAQIITELTSEMKEELIEILFQYREAFASDNEPLGAIKGHEVDIMLNVKGPYPTLLRRPAYPASPRAREALDSHIDELVKLGVLGNVGHN
ncbi:hypothetical protein O181_085827 [Austropuccinia psidii MF-1]|uniref:Uncharacterized protein n=1 Tax=Austropuccinia psidii MF-1 TaxID=1389203 RepID=A0A9Q3FWU7_9BASI|nr:hypothetical protein [Austropuccinia psidii MF-1]